MSRLTRSRRQRRAMASLGLQQLPLGLPMTPEEVRRSLVVLPPFEREHEPEPLAPAAMARRAA